MSVKADNLLLFALFKTMLKIIIVILHVKYAGIEPPVFAALVPNSADKPLKDVMEEIMDDHEMMVYSYNFT